MASYSPIPFIYRLTFHYIEPIAACLGGLSILFAPLATLEGQTPNLLQYYSAPLRPLTLQIAGGWFLLSFNDAVILRYTNDRNIWRMVLTAGLISDALYITSIWMDLGNARFFNPMLWDAASGFTIVSTILPQLAKITFLLGIGTGEKSKDTTKKRQ
ncbi:hypothetical protein NA57DRAFT_75763 [Rhizodiscina lignyota]|uniref:DUF7704 domain-containing protein n=1 Tax=Rhizodiscina lignyota TaxID=1504668 RepID=A0A9P4IEG9_9PEZI|nr:hypothetical protein NA57DRAFT_75763 [Rhizodiscina lignyota]